MFSKIYSNIKEAYSKLNPATLSGAIDAIIVEQPDGSYLCSPFHVRFGKLGILQPKEREIDIEVNGRSVDLRMVLDDNGTAYFMPPINSSEDLSASTNSLLNFVSSTEELPRFLSPEEAADREVDRIFTDSMQIGHPSQVLSEPEHSPISSPIGSRPQSPSAKSDSEAPSLRWTTEPAKLLEKGQHLDDIISSVDRENLNLYIGSTERDNDDDVESGRGVSMPQSPQPPSTVSRVQELLSQSSNNSSLSAELCGEIALSLCGPLVGPEGDVSLEEFQQYRLSWEAFERDPLRHVSNLDLFVWLMKQDGNTAAGQKIKCVPWSVFSAQIAAQIAFGRSFSNDLISQMSSRCLGERLASDSQNSSWFRFVLPRRTKTTTTVTSDKTLRPVVSDGASPPEKEMSPTSTKAPQPGVTVAQLPSSPTATTNTPPTEKTSPSKVSSVSSRYADVRFATDTEDDDEMFTPKNPQLMLDLNRATHGKERRHPPLRRRNLSCNTSRPSGRRKSRRLTTEQIKALELNQGENVFAFSLSHQILGTTRLTCRAFVWKWDDRIIISDIDGTITRSDVLGQVLPIMGYEWTQPGVGRLFSLLIKNNYKILYLSARAIGLAQQTREYLSSIEDLPSGPLLLSPASLANAFYKEVIERVPERFKINCLREIMKLFPVHTEDEPGVDPSGIEIPHSPYYAGFGNRPNDAKAYREVCVPPARIYIVNPSAQVRIDMGSFRSTYDMLAESVDLFFPVYSCPSHMHNEYSSFEFWRPKPASE